jgi:hypothetical protein
MNVPHTGQMPRTTTRTSELRDSRDRLGDWEALRALIADEGYVFMRGLLDPHQVRDIGRRGWLICKPPAGRSPEAIP